MSKKRFTEGLESIFGEAADDTLQEDNPLLGGKEKKTPKKQAGESGRRSSGKDFSSDLQSFLQEAFDESLEQQLEQREKRKAGLATTAKVKKRSRRPMTGLDALIRSTVEPENVRLQESAGHRITLTIDPKKLDKLKAIARSKRTYLRDIIDEIVAEFIEEHEKQKGR